MAKLKHIIIFILPVSLNNTCIPAV